MKKKIISLMAAVAFLQAVGLIEQEEFSLVQSVIPGTKIEKVKHTPIDGLYAAYLKNGNILYVYPYKRLIVVGAIYTNTGINLTDKEKKVWQEEVKKKELKKLNKYELIKDAFKLNYGKGSNRYEIVLFTDPECPFCRRVDKFLREKKPDVTFYVNYMPLYFHPHAKKWALEILSSKNKKEAIEKIEKTNKDLNVTITKEAMETLKNMQALAKKLRIRGTPTMFVIDKKTGNIVDVINGADLQKLKKWIKENK